MLAPNDELLQRVFRPRTTIEPDGTVEGYASLFGEVDQARDMVMPGAFTQTLKLRGLRRVPMLFQHDPAEPVGIWLELREDQHGLYARGRLIPEVARGRELFALVKAGAIDGLSIGFRTIKGRVDPRSRIRKIDQIDLGDFDRYLPAAERRARARAEGCALAGAIASGSVRAAVHAPPTLVLRAQASGARLAGDCACDGGAAGARNL